MDNLLANATLESDENGFPMYYAATGPITYDNFIIDGFRTCSITMPDGQTAMAGYVPFINIAGKTKLQLGLTMRVIDMKFLYYVASFFDSDKKYIDSQRKDVRYLVTDNFDDVFENYDIPKDAVFARVDIIFINKVTACTFYNPRVFAI